MLLDNLRQDLRVRLPVVPEGAVVHARHPHDAGARHRRLDGDLLDGQRHPAAAAAAAGRRSSRLPQRAGPRQSDLRRRGRTSSTGGRGRMRFKGWRCRERSRSRSPGSPSRSGYAPGGRPAISFRSSACQPTARPRVRGRRRSTGCRTDGHRQPRILADAPGRGRERARQAAGARRARRTPSSACCRPGSATCAPTISSSRWVRLSTTSF